jgi:hypothetical protein
MTTLCTEFQREARRISQLLRKGERAGVRLAEETITNLVLVNLSLHRSSGFDIRGYSKADEARLGADWEMWLVGYTGRLLGFRVQAKVYNPATASFDHLHYRKDASSPYQCDTLIAKAHSSWPVRVPLYALYSRAPHFALARWPCGSFSQRQELLSCAIVHARTVQKLRLAGGAKRLIDVAPHLRPWHCLVCCSGFGGNDLAARAQRWVDEVLHGPAGPETGIEARQAEGAVSDGDEIPYYVRSILDGGKPELPDDIAAVLVVRERAPAA